MKLKTKFQDEDFELGEVVDVIISTTSLVDTHIKLKAKSKRGGEHMFNFSRISELFDLFEDYEEPKEYWYVSCDGRALKATTDEDDYNEKHNTGHRQIGNYFETKEEAEKAVEKLKAWKRLEDKGFVFKGINMGDGSIKTGLSKGVSLDDCEGFYSDMALLFGGEE